MASLNKVFLIGNLTKDPELRYTPGGVAVANMRIAVNRKFKDKSGEMKEDTCYMTITAWDKQAEVCNQYLQKGRPIFVEGRLQSRSWETPDGQKRSAVDVRAERIQFLGGSPKENKTEVAPEVENSDEEAHPGSMSWGAEGNSSKKNQGVKDNHVQGQTKADTVSWEEEDIS
jgi:single-strand DNA-binding protein